MLIKIVRRLRRVGIGDESGAGRGVGEQYTRGLREGVERDE
jgi:hypothetical protein